jgi:hypothetical protein
MAGSAGPSSQAAADGLYALGAGSTGVLDFGGAGDEGAGDGVLRYDVEFGKGKKVALYAACKHYQIYLPASIVVRVSPAQRNAGATREGALRIRADAFHRGVVKDRQGQARGTRARWKPPAGSCSADEMGRCTQLSSEPPRCAARA